MFRVAVAVVLLLGGCGPGFEPAQTCVLRGGVVTHLAAPCECSYYEAVLADALIAVREKAAMTPGEEAAALDGLTLWVRGSAEGFSCGSVQGAYGCYHAMSGDMELTVDATSLFHELLHRLEHVRGQSPDAHEGWETRGAPPSAPLVDRPPGLVREGSWWDTTFTFGRRWRSAGGWENHMP